MQTSTHTNCLLLRVLRKEQLVSELSDAEVDLLIRQARPSRLLSTVAHLAEQEQAWEQLPAGAVRQFKSALILAEANLRTLKWELNRIQEALIHADFPVILLKGAAYAALELPNSHGRLFGDIDLLVPKEQLEKTETWLNWKGWFSPYNNPYDQRYFREWMHELPPLQHSKRGSVLDIHHTIVAPTSRIRADTRAIFQQVTAIPEKFFYTPQPHDLILHSATHLFVNGEFEHASRDLYDMHLMLIHFSQRGNFLHELCQRANQTGLARQLYFALRYCRLLFNTPLPENLEDQLNDRPGAVSASLLDQLFSRAIMPDHQSSRPVGCLLARHCLYIRSHYLRMPMHLLIPHLVSKSLRAKEYEDKP